MSQKTFSEMAEVGQSRISELENRRLHLFAVDGLLLLAQRTGLSISSTITTSDEGGKPTIKVGITAQA